MSLGAQTVAARLSDIVGAAGLVTDPGQLLRYEIGALRPAAAVRPASAAEIAEILKFAVAEKLAVIPAGARTKLGIGLPPRRYDLAVDMTRLDRIVAYDPGDLTLSVEAGVSLCQLQTTLSEHGQFLPLAVPFMERTTAGGTIASGMDSPLRHAYGTARDFVLGMEFVTGDGTFAKSGGRVVKNVTGYDLHKLMIGSHGTLGIITKINFRTFPQPISPRGFVAHFPASEAALEMRRRLAQSPLRPLSLEIFSPRAAGLFSSEAAARITKSQMPANPLSCDRWAFTAGFAGGDAVLARCESELTRMASDCGAASISILSGALGPAWARKREFIPIALASSPAATIIKIGALPSRMGDALNHAAAAADASALPWAAMARGAGVIHFAILPEESVNPDDPEIRVRVLAAARRIQSEIQNLGGNFSIPWCPAAWKPAFAGLIWGVARSDLAQMQKLKQVFDARAILSPGRFVGGL